MSDKEKRQIRGFALPRGGSGGSSEGPRSSISTSSLSTPVTLKTDADLESSRRCKLCMIKYKHSPCSITERRVLELIPVRCSQPAGDVSHKPGGRLPLLSARPAVTLATSRGLLPVLLLGEPGAQRV